MVASKKRKDKKQSGIWTYLLGLVGLVCLFISGAGLWLTLSEETTASVAETVPPPDGDSAAVSTGQVSQSRSADQPRVVGVVDVNDQGGDEPADFYPLEVGRYWVYSRQDPVSGTVMEVERRIVRREKRPDRELFFFGDGTVAYREEDKIYEMGPEGGVNVVPIAVEQDAPYTYRSQGLYIEKQVGARDTVLMASGRRYEKCLQVITRFRRSEEAEELAYASYYAPGIGLVGREMWPTRGGQPAEVLRDYGPRQM